MILLLGRKGVKADSKDSRNRSPLSYAAQGGTRDNSEIKADSRNSYNRLPLLFAAENGHEVVKLLLARKDVAKDSQIYSSL